MEDFDKGVQYSKDKLIKIIINNFNNSISDNEQIVKLNKYLSAIMSNEEITDDYIEFAPVSKRIIEDTFDFGVNVFIKYFICVFLRTEAGSRPGEYVRFIDKISYVFDELFNLNDFITKDKFDFIIDNYKKILLLK